jgi:hypothetical protein
MLHGLRGVWMGSVSRTNLRAPALVATLPFRAFLKSPGTKH